MNNIPFHRRMQMKRNTTVIALTLLIVFLASPALCQDMGQCLAIILPGF